MESLEKKIFKNEFVENFRGDESGDLSPRQTPGVFYSKAQPTAVKEPKIIAWNEELSRELNMAAPTQETVQILGGNLLTPSMRPYAACYAGHQFGSWAGQLGDGRAITLGEWETENTSWELQLKGAGPTPYSRRADGRAVLRSSVREYLMSEAMHYLGIPTTRALSLVSTGEDILRDMFYDGNPEYEPGAIVMRVSPSFLRFGSFEMLTARNELKHLEELTEWTISRYYPHITGEDKIIRWFEEITKKTAELMVEWQRVGFVHGVMNTDNMSILGLTIDYGPFSFLDNYDPNFTPNTTDLPGRRYAFGNQASIGYWNVSRLANALVPLFEGTEQLEEVLESYERYFWEKYYSMMAKKLGLDKIEKEEQQLIAQVEDNLASLQPDMTIFYRLLIDLPLELKEEEEVLLYFQDSFYQPLKEAQITAFASLIHDYSTRIKKNKIPRQESQNLMKSVNPKFILRNYLLHQAIEKLEAGDDSLFRQLEEALKNPYSDTGVFFSKRPEWASRQAGCSMLSCSS